MRVKEEREDEETVRLCELNSAASQAELRYAVKEKLQIELLKATVLRIKLFSSFSLNDYTGSYITVLTEKEDSVATVMREVENETDTDKLISRRNDISLQDVTTITTAVKEVEEEEDIIIRAVLLQLIDIIISAFNLAFLTVTETAVTSQRYLLTRKHQNKFSTVLQE
ncbi:hypothetical protein BDDG_00433 [Blastomyces dermatitidis ATCC 18188]|uniref:Uncharacterized protein n=1 Tax=Ajellomyces dermatitidis (strain ATCC 18188 / CBS 674.68) TaxID=653446 RepID=F2T212_AJEDA|nr:hypothetical protein BDDG_00433 [Blastomyces dermatitidis ATCC 18188]